MAAAFLVALALPVIRPAAPVAASDCGTNWTSRTVPPSTIRVLRTRTGDVDIVDFRDYVGIVLASGEFPTTDPAPVVEVGATAVKQFGWYYALKGNHRASYRTADGVCYDVRDDTSDQLFHPEAKATQKQLDAVAATWGLTLRKKGRFFLTGYRYGNNVGCAADANGWRLFEQSMIRCAKQGWDRQKIQQRYYEPGVQFVWNNQPAPAKKGDSTPPTISIPRAGLKASGTGAPQLIVKWKTYDSGGGVAGVRAQRSVDGGAWQDVKLSKPAAGGLALPLNPGHTDQFRIQARDKAGNATTWAQGPTFTPRLVGAGQAQLSGHWTLVSQPGSSTGDSVTASQKGARASLSFTGRSVAVVGARGPHSGQAHVFIDRRLVATIDLRATRDETGQVLFTKSWPSHGKHAISVEVIGTSGRPAVELATFVILQ